MNKHNRNGHVALMAIAIVGMLAVAGLIVYALRGQSGNKGPDQPLSTQTVATESQLELQNIGIDTLDNVLVSTSVLREYDSMGLKGFYIFGEKLGGKTDTRLNPNFEFSSLKASTKVISAIDGVVTFIREQPDTKDYEVFIQPRDKSAWTIGYDHISNVAVKKDAKIKVGDLIGNPSIQNNGAYRFEFQINKDENGVTTHYCPSTLLSASTKSDTYSGLMDIQEQWNKVAGQKLYTVSDQKPVGCLKPTMTVAEAEGR